MIEKSCKNYNVWYAMKKCVSTDWLFHYIQHGAISEKLEDFLYRNFW
jgi:hypothetical protein